MSRPLPPESADENPDPPRRARTRRRWYQFSLGTILLLMVLCGLLLAAWRAYLAPYRAQRETMALIERLKGSYQTQEAATWANRVAFTVQNIVVVNLADCDQPTEYLDAISRLPRLETLVVGGLAFGDEHLAALHKLSTLRWLVLDSTSVTDAGEEALQHALPNLSVHRSERRIIAGFRTLGPCVGTESSNNCAVPPELVELHFFEYAKILRFDRLRVTDADLVHLPRLKNAEYLYLDSTQVTDASLTHLTALKRLLALGLSDTQVTDAGLAHLVSLKNLTVLDVSMTKITDAGLALLVGLNNLEGLYLSDTQVTDSSLAHLAGLKRLVNLALINTKVTDAGLTHLAGLNNLGDLCLSKTQVTDAGLAHLTGLKNLNGLLLSSTQVTDNGLVHLAGLKKLKILSLDSTKVTDAGLAHLAGLKNLEQLDLVNTKVTEVGVAKLRHAVPKCEVTR